MTWDSLEAYCVAVIGLTPEVHARSSFAKVVEYIRQFNLAEEMKQRISWEQVRWQTAALLNVHVKKGRQLRPVDLVKFPWEKSHVPKPKILDKQDKFKKFNRWDREMRRMHEEQQSNGKK